MYQMALLEQTSF